MKKLYGEINKDNIKVVMEVTIITTIVSIIIGIKVIVIKITAIIITVMIIIRPSQVRRVCFVNKCYFSTFQETNVV